jgi:hypothetical protein
VSPFTAFALEPIDPIEGDPSDVRQFAHELRRLTGRLDVPRQATVSLQAVRHSGVWDGDGFRAFLTLVEKLPKPADIDNAVDRFHWLATELETFADVLDECQAENRRCRRELDEAHPPDVELTDEVLSTMSGISLQASRSLERLDEASTRLAQAFDDMDQLTIYAEPPPGVLERVGSGLVAFQEWNDRVGREFVIGIGTGAWEMVKGVGMLAFYLNPVVLPFTAKKLWQHRESIVAVATFAREHPRSFATEMGKAVVDWETLDESPARWLGKMVPDLLLAIATVGSGSVATKASSSTVRLLKAGDRFADAGQDLSKAGRALRHGRALLDRTRIALHDKPELVDSFVDPFLAKPGIGPLDPTSALARRKVNRLPTMVKDAATGGWYSRMSLANRWVNGVPGLSGPELAFFTAPRVLSRGGQLDNIRTLDAAVHELTSPTEPSPGEPPPRDAAGSPPAPPPGTTVPSSSPTGATAPAPPPRRYQTTTSAGPP